MTGNRLSMSRLWLAYKCSYFARPDVHYSEPPSGAAARIGSLVHLFQEMHVNGVSKDVDDVDLSELATAKAIMDGPFRDWLDSTKWTACEIGLRYDAENDVSVIGPRRGDPGYDNHGAMVLKGTLDLVEDVPSILTVVDTKTGKVDGAHAEQLYGQAVAAARFYGRDRSRVGFVFPRKTKVIEPVWEELDADRLDYEAGRIRRVLRTIPTSKPNPGDHCWRCPAMRVCPAHARDDDRYAPEPTLLSDAPMF